MSRPEVDESLRQDFIKVILTKDQRRSKRDKKWTRIRKSKYVELNGTCYCIRKFNIALSLYGVLEVALYFSEGFSEAATGGLVVAEALQLLGVTVVWFLGQKSNLWSLVP